ncbi:ferredoxin [Candidatus Woesearchaeota archaeon]|nr:ferredoxin [Candidatus Woesearchaeota archaeon]
MGKKYKIIYDKKGCIGGTICADVAPDFWKMEGDIATLTKPSAQKNEEYEELIIDEKDLQINIEAAEGCPVYVIKIIDLETGEQIVPKPR